VKRGDDRRWLTGEERLTEFCTDNQTQHESIINTNYIYIQLTLIPSMTIISASQGRAPVHAGHTKDATFDA
jgi:hypothetical protein